MLWLSALLLPVVSVAVAHSQARAHLVLCVALQEELDEARKNEELLLGQSASSNRTLFE